MKYLHKLKPLITIFKFSFLPNPTMKEIYQNNSIKFLLFGRNFFSLQSQLVCTVLQQL